MGFGKFLNLEYVWPFLAASRDAVFRKISYFPHLRILTYLSAAANVTCSARWVVCVNRQDQIIGRCVFSDVVLLVLASRVSVIIPKYLI